MACEAEAERDSTSNPLATPPATLRAPPSSTQRKQNGDCFGCGQKGHWIKNCPTKILNRNESPLSTPGSHSNVPVLRCGCRTTCSIRVSKSDKNPNRKYYHCPNCGFIDFCDKFEALMCPCAAGLCTINLDQNGEKRPDFYYTKTENKRCYYTCRIRMGHGACCFIQFGSGQRLWNSQLVPILSEKRKESTMHHTILARNQDSSNGCRLFTVEGGTRVSRLGSQSEIRDRQIAFTSQMSSAGDSPNECKIVYILGVRVFGWLGRLAFPPSPSLADPPSCNTCNYYGSSSVGLLSDARLEQVSPASPNLNSSGIPSSSSHKRVRSAGKNDPPLEELTERYMIEKCHSSDILEMHREAVAAFTTCDRQLQSLRERAGCIKNMLGEVEKQLLPCEAETEKLKNDVQELSKLLMHSKRKMQVTSRELREAVRDALGKAR